MAHYLIEEELIDFVATDTHNETHIKKLSNITLNKSFAESFLLLLKILVVCFLKLNLRLCTRTVTNIIKKVYTYSNHMCPRIISGNIVNG